IDAAAADGQLAPSGRGRTAVRGREAVVHAHGLRAARRERGGGRAPALGRLHADGEHPDARGRDLRRDRVDQPGVAGPPAHRRDRARPPADRARSGGRSQRAPGDLQPLVRTAVQPLTGEPGSERPASDPAGDPVVAAAPAEGRAGTDSAETGRVDLRETYRKQLLDSIGGWTGTVITAIPPVVFVVV